MVHENVAPDSVGSSLESRLTMNFEPGQLTRSSISFREPLRLKNVSAHDGVVQSSCTYVMVQLNLVVWYHHGKTTEKDDVPVTRDLHKYSVSSYPYKGG
jgi:hypothetical protein